MDGSDGVPVPSLNWNPWLPPAAGVWRVGGTPDAVLPWEAPALKLNFAGWGMFPPDGADCALKLKPEDCVLLPKRAGWAPWLVGCVLVLLNLKRAGFAGCALTLLRRDDCVLEALKREGWLVD